MSWAAEEFREIDLGDRRLNRRAVLLAERLAAKPEASLPGACGGWAETMAAYRFFQHEKLDWRDLMAPHWRSAEARMRPCPVVLCLADTTELDFNGQAMAGLGPLSYEAQRGMYLHATYAVTPDREPLGVLDAWMWAREPKDAKTGSRPGVKESVRWIEGYERIAELAAGLPQTRLVFVADRESDILALMQRAHALAHPADWLVRAQHNRTLPGGQRLWAASTVGEPLGGVCFALPARPGQAARLVRQAVWVSTIELPDGRDGLLSVTCVVARELSPPAGVKPVEWRLLTNRTVAGLEAAIELIDWYRARWEIEQYWNVVKNGCRVEALQLGTVERLERALALFLIVAWRIARLMRLGRTDPELDASLLFERDEWIAAYALNKRKPPAQPPTLNEVVRLVAMCGGFLGRKSDGEPGAKTLWLGLQAVMQFAEGIRFARENHVG